MIVKNQNLKKKDVFWLEQLIKKIEILVQFLENLVFHELQFTNT